MDPQQPRTPPPFESAEQDRPRRMAPPRRNSTLGPMILAFLVLIGIVVLVVLI
jgi:hypothetical protein